MSVKSYLEACLADDRWHAELTRLYGKRAGDVRYTKAGRGEPGSTLRSLYEAAMAANAANMADMLANR